MSQRMRRGMMLGTLVALVIVAVVAAAAHYRSSEQVLVAYVANAGNNSVQVIDLESGRTLRKIYAGATPWRLVVAPGRRSLWVQHWYSGMTAVVDLRTHEIVGTFAARGPGVFSAAGDRFLSFDWPASSLKTVDAKSLELVKEEASEVPRVYDVAADPDGRRLLLAQFDPLAKGPHQRYGYVVDYALDTKSEGSPTPKSLPTGQSPVRIKTVSSGAFFITADSESNGLTLVNRLGDRRTLSTCAAPQALAIAPDERRMIVACWAGNGSPRSRLVSYRTDFAARPWPTIVEDKSSDLEGALVAGGFSPSGTQAYFVDRVKRRLIELEPLSLKITREIQTGDVPLDVAIVSVKAADRDQAAQTESRSRALLKSILARLGARPKAVRQLSWTESIRSLDLAAAQAPRRIAMSYRAPDALRTETEGGGIRLAQGGHAVSIDPGGRFWVSPRQELMTALYALAALPIEQAIQELAGDVRGSPYLRGGLAVDLVFSEGSSYRIGASKADDRVSQLWLDERGRPSKLVEQFPVFAAGGHGEAGFRGIVETTFHDFTTASGVDYASRLQRTVDGQLLQEVRIENLNVAAGVEARFDLAQLGGAPASHIAPSAATAAANSAPGRAVPILDVGYLSSPEEPHAPYNSNPPTSGPRLPYLAEWGVHQVPVPLELQVHNLEHGGVVIQYDCPQGCAKLAGEIAQFAQGRELLLVAPYPHLDSLIALTAWGRIELLDALDLPRIERFISDYGGRDHHARASAASASVH